MNAELITIGTELLLGQIVDTNAAHIAQRLAEVGVNLFYKTTVGDNRARAAAVLRQAIARSDVVIVTGGLGPTVDDITREAIADAAERPIVRDPALVARIDHIFRRWGREPGANNYRQADLPEGAVALDNPIGTAPGLRLEVGDTLIVAMPGVPREMKRMLDEQVLPLLRERSGGEVVIKSKVLRLAGIGESQIDELIDEPMRWHNPTVGLAAHIGQVDVRITARAPSAREAEIMIAQAEAKIRPRLADWIFGEGTETLEGAITALLAARSETLALRESSSEGHLAARLRATAHPETLCAAEIVAPAALPSAEDGMRAAEALRAATGATWAVAILGRAGPETGVYQEDTGETLIALAGPQGSTARHFALGGTDELSRAWVENRALTFLRQQLTA